MAGEGGDGSILRTITAQNYFCNLGTGIAFDGTSLLLSCNRNNIITAVSPVDGSFVRSYTITGISVIGAIAWDHGRNQLWACGGFGPSENVVHRIDVSAETGNVIFTSSAPCPDGLAYDGTDDTIWLSPDVASTFYHYKSDGTLLGSYPANVGACGNSGIAVGGPYLFLANNGCSEIYRAPKTDPTATELFGGYPARLEDLECDDLTFRSTGKAAIWSKDAYDAVLNAFELNPGDCGFGGLPPAPAAYRGIGGAKVCAEDLLVRTAPDGEARGTLYEGELFKVERYSETGRWAYGVAYGGVSQRGWVLAEYLCGSRAQVARSTVPSIVRLLAPLIYLHPDERYFPMSTSAFVVASELWFAHYGGCADDVDAHRVDPTRLGSDFGYSHYSKNEGCGHAGVPWFSDEFTRPYDSAPEHGLRAFPLPEDEGFYLWPRAEDRERTK